MQTMQSIQSIGGIRRPPIMRHKLFLWKRFVALSGRRGQRAPAPLLGNEGVGHAYLAHGPHWRTRCWGIAGTSCVCLTLCVGAFVSWITPLQLAVHQSPAPLSVIQMSGPSDQPSPAESRRETSDPPKTPAEPAPDASRTPVLPSQTAALVVPTAMASPSPASGAMAASHATLASVSSPPSPPSAASTARAEAHAAAHHVPPSGQARSSWEGEVLRHLEKFRRYPSAARVRGQQGVTYVAFTMNRSGQVIRASILQSSEVQILDRAALDTLRRAQPLPAIPADMPDVVDITIPVEFFKSR